MERLDSQSERSGSGEFSGVNKDLSRAPHRLLLPTVLFETSSRGSASCEVIGRQSSRLQEWRESVSREHVSLYNLGQLTAAWTTKEVSNGCFPSCYHTNQAVRELLEIDHNDRSFEGLLLVGNQHTMVNNPRTGSRSLIGFTDHLCSSFASSCLLEALLKTDSLTIE
jgi:hypothetical protein